MGENQGNTFLFGFRRVWLSAVSCSITTHLPPPVKPAPQLQSPRPRVLTPGSPDSLETSPKSSQKQGRFLVIKGNFSSYLWGGERLRPRTQDYTSEETSIPPRGCLEAMVQPAVAAGSCPGPSRCTWRGPGSMCSLEWRGKTTQSS